MGCNSVSLTGNLVRDGELRHTGKVAILNFTLAVDERRKDEAGKWYNNPVYVDCAMFGNRAMSVADSFTRGKKLTVDGRLTMRRWQADGKNYSKLAVLVDDFAYMSTPQQKEAQNG